MENLQVLLLELSSVLLLTVVLLQHIQLRKVAEARRKHTRLPK